MYRFVQVVFLCLVATAASAQDRVFITNVHVFDGVSDRRIENANVLVEGNLIAKVSTDPIPADGAMLIDGLGGTLMPGLIDMHTHVMFKYGVPATRADIDPAAAGAVAYETMQLYLQMGYTTLRDVGGNSLGLARALAAGRLKGPRLYSSGGQISGISGHADLGLLTQDPMDSVFQVRGDTNVATGPYEVRAAVRRVFRGGATHVKVMPGGGVASSFDPLESNSMSLDELTAAVDAAADFQSYVCAHAYGDESINRFLDAGGRCIEHGFLAEEDTIKRMKNLGAVMSLQAYAAYEVFKDPESIPGFSAENARKGRQVHEGADRMLGWIAKYEVDAFGGSDLWTFDQLPLVPQDLVVRKRWFSDVEILRQNTSKAARWLAKSGPKNPYKDGPLGVIAEGAYADLIIVDGDPTQDVSILVDYKNAILLTMKDGEIFKNALAP